MCLMDASRSAPIGKKIKRARERRRMSQAEAAEKLGVSRSALNAWENDRAYPRSSIGAIEALYGIVIDDEPQPPPGISDDLRAAIMNDPELTDAEREAVLAAVKRQIATERGWGVSSSGPGDAPGQRWPAS